MFGAWASLSDGPTPASCFSAWKMRAAQRATPLHGGPISLDGSTQQFAVLFPARDWSGKQLRGSELRVTATIAGEQKSQN